MALPYRPNTLEYPLSPAQVEGLNATLENIYTELRRLTASTHKLLSPTHEDTEAATEVDGDLITGQDGEWKRLPVGNDKEHLVVNGSDPEWGTDGSALTDLNADEITSGTLDPARLADSGVAAGTYGDATHVPQVAIDAKGRVTSAVDVALSLPPTTHSLLSATHPDTTPASPTLGDVVIAQTGAAVDIGKYFVDGGAFDYVPNANDAGAETFWLAGLPASGLVSSGAVTWARKANGTLGYVLTAGATGPDWQPAGSTSGNLGARVYRSSNFALSDRTQTPVTLTTVTSDNGSFWSAGAPTRLTIPSGSGGLYAIHAQASFAALTGRKVYVEIYVNGVIKAQSGGDMKVLQASTILQLSSSDYVELYLYAEQNVAGDLDTVQGGATSTFLSIGRLNSETVTATGLPSPVAGAIIKGNSGGTAYDRVLIGTSGQVLLSDGSAPGWSSRPTLRDVAEAVSGVWDFSNGLKERGRSKKIGEPTDQPYAAGDFTASGAMTWTVDLADVITFAYFEIGEYLFVTGSFNTTSIGGVVSNQLFVRIPGGFTAQSGSVFKCRISDNGTERDDAICFTSVGGTVITVQRASAANFTASANLTSIQLSMFFKKS